MVVFLLLRSLSEPSLKFPRLLQSWSDSSKFGQHHSVLIHRHTPLKLPFRCPRWPFYVQRCCQPVSITGNTKGQHVLINYSPLCTTPRGLYACYHLYSPNFSPSVAHTVTLLGSKSMPLISKEHSGTRNTWRFNPFCLCVHTWITLLHPQGCAPRQVHQRAKKNLLAWLSISTAKHDKVSSMCPQMNQQKLAQPWWP